MYIIFHQHKSYWNKEMDLENLFLNPAYLAAFLFALNISVAFNMDCEIQYPSIPYSSKAVFRITSL